MSTWIWILIIVAAAIISALVTAWLVKRHDNRKIAYIIDSIDDDVLNFRFRENTKLNRTLNRVRDVFERRRAINEEASWSKLFRVMTHEIMNTVAPIASLSDALSKDENLDVKAGLETISASSKDLIRFVESYRSFTKVAQPVRKAVMVNELIDRVLRLNEANCADHGVTLTYTVKTDDLLVYADEGQIIQVFNNLIKNAIQAEANSIRISAELNKDDQTVIYVTNNGKPIPLRQIDEIFVPFYTTKQTGSGIGLSVSRQIMTKHNGNLTLVQSDSTMTKFAIIFK
ncbi:MAG: HAMP domain-containing histidine kinase [Bacteroidales bacterium]|nr:HAMP domain-containing histidine kinase [Bacteroidales bacterium]